MPSVFEWTTAIFKFFQNTLGVSPLGVVSKVVEVTENAVEDLRSPNVSNAPVKPPHDWYEDYLREKAAEEHRIKVKANEAALANQAVTVDGIVTLTSSTFDETVNGSSKPILVDFWAEWCGPCKMIAPILAEIAVEQKDSLVISKLNVDEHGDIAQRYNVMSIPTLLLFNNGELVKRLVGAKGKGALLQELSEFLTPSP